MGRYLLRRILLFVPTLFIIAVLSFILSQKAPGDPLDRLVSAQENTGEMSPQNENTLREKERWRKKLGLDLPVFYCSVSSLATPDTLYKIYDDNKRIAIRRLVQQNGNGDAVMQWQKTLAEFTGQIAALAESVHAENDSMRFVITDSISEVFLLANSLQYAYTSNQIQSVLHRLESSINSDPTFAPLRPQFSTVLTTHEAMGSKAQKWKCYIPTIRFYGKNQFHRWLFGDGNWLSGKGAQDSRGILRGDFGYSYETKQPVDKIIGERIVWSLTLTLVSVLLAYLISVPIGIRAAAHKDSFFDRSTGVLLFILYSMPAFWLATLLLMTFANPEVFAVFPASGVGPAGGIPEDAGWLEIIRLRLPYLILPTIAYTYAQLAFLSRITRVSMLEVIHQDYIRTAQAKGLPNNRVIRKHAFRNALLPLITVFSNIFPAAIGGSVILETIFSIPGMGQQIFNAILSKDYPVIMAVFTLTGIMTLVGYLVADILYKLADPRITLTGK